MDSFLDRLLADEGAADRQSASRTAPPAAPPSRGASQASREHEVGLADTAHGATPTASARPSPDGPLPNVPLGLEAPRIAIYDTLTSPPRVIAVEEGDLPALIASLAEKTYHYCREQGGQVPYSVIQELIENLLHAYFRDVVITILDNGQTIRISDHGPGVDDKDRAFQPGFTTATAYQREIIRGVGSGLPLARESLQFLRGILTVEDNLGGGAVFTIKMPSAAEAPAASAGIPRSSSPPARRRSWCCSWSSAPPARQPSPKSSVFARDGVQGTRCTARHGVDTLARGRQASLARGRPPPPRKHPLTDVHKAPRWAAASPGSSWRGTHGRRTHTHLGRGEEASSRAHQRLRLPILVRPDGAARPG